MKSCKKPFKNIKLFYQNHSKNIEWVFQWTQRLQSCFCIELCQLYLLSIRVYLRIKTCTLRRQLLRLKQIVYVCNGETMYSMNTIHAHLFLQCLRVTEMQPTKESQNNTLRHIFVAIVTQKKRQKCVWTSCLNVTSIHESPEMKRRPCIFWCTK